MVRRSETLYKTQDLCGQHGANSEVPELIAQNFTTLQSTLLPKLHKVFIEHQDANPSFSVLSAYSQLNLCMETWGDMHTAIGNLMWRCTLRSVCRRTSLWKLSI